MKKLYYIPLFFVVIFIVIYFYSTAIANKNFLSEEFIKISTNYEYEIERDTYGVPHIFGNNDHDAAFGFGFAQTEDDYENIEFVIKMARGELSDLNISFSALVDLFNLATGTGDIMSSISAIEGIEIDYLVKFLNTKEVALSLKDTVDKETLTYLRGYADGINYWAALNSQKVDKSLFPVTEDDLLVGMIFRMPLFYGLDHHIDQLIKLMSEPNEQLVATNELSNNKLVATSCSLGSDINLIS